MYIYIVLDQNNKAVGYSNLAGPVYKSDYIEVADEGVASIHLGDTYDQSTKTWIPPSPVTPSVSTLSAANLISVFTDDEQDTIFSSTDNKVEKLIQQLSLWAATGVPIKANARLHGMLDALANAGVITQARSDEIMAILSNLGG